MSIGSALAIYFILWWVVLFAVLPMRVETAARVGAGHADSAPVAPLIWWKVKRTTLITSAIFAVFYLNYTQEWITLADLPWLRRSGAA